MNSSDLSLPASSSMATVQHTFAELGSARVVRLQYSLISHASSTASAITSVGSAESSKSVHEGAEQPLHAFSPFFGEPFPDERMQNDFLARIKHIAAFWCCRKKDSPQLHGGTPYAPMILGEGIKFTH
jgi:hypothetical protein